MKYYYDIRDLFLIGSVVFIFFAVQNSQANVTDSQNLRLELRNQTAIHYTDPESHLKLARYHYDKGHKVQAFYISEHVRKVFGDEAFEPAFNKVAAVKLKKSIEFKNEQEYNQYCKENPNSFEAFMLDFEENLTHRDNDKIVEDALVKYPNHYVLKAIAAKYYLKVAENEEKALPLYIDLYFDNPHFYDWEYAEFRIKQLTSSLKETWFEETVTQGEPLIDIVAKESNPRILDILIVQSRSKWDDSLTPVMLEILKNDDPTLQSQALHTLLKNPESLEGSEEILKLVKSEDLVVRAISSFLIVKCFGRDSYHLLLGNLNSGIELIQLDTIQALAFMGGEDGKRFLKENKPENATEKMISFWKKVTAD